MFSNNPAHAMRATTACRILRSVSLCLLVVVGILVAGCDSSGSNGGGGNLSGAVTATVDGGEATGGLAVNFTYRTDDGTCSEVAFTENFDAPGDREFDPEVISFRCEVSANDWDEVEVTFNPNDSAEGLTLTLTSGGSEIASTSSPTDNGNLVATAGSVNDGS
jgi:hypothetical protein